MKNSEQDIFTLVSTRRENGRTVLVVQKKGVHMTITPESTPSLLAILDEHFPGEIDDFFGFDADAAES